MNRIALCFSLLLSSLVCEVAMSDPAKVDDWIGPRCAAYRGEYCRIPYAALFANPARIAALGSKVRLRGYLIRENGTYVLYADKDAAQLGWRSAAIAVLETDNAAIRDSLKKWEKGFVMLDGAVILEASDSDEYWLSFKPDKPAMVQGVRGEKLR
jgi:hypothetical protein